MKNPIFLCLLASSLSLVGCRAEEFDTADTATDSQSEALESAITVISGQADEASGGSFAMRQSAREWKYALAEKIFWQPAQASNCGRAFDQSCDNATGTKTASYSSCAIGTRGFSLTGSVTLTYSNNSCSLAVGENVVRRFDHTITGPHGGAVQTTSALRTDYRGTQIGGGGRITRTAASDWEMELIGKHKIGSRNGRRLFDVSIRTSAPLTVNGSIARSGRTISSGAVEINHNLAEFSSVYTVTQPLVWNATCCHPVSGALNASFSGSITGQGTITFNGCGSAELSKDGSTRTLSIGYCE